MATTKRIHVPPSTLHAIVIDITPANSGITDLSLVVADKMRLRDPSGTETDLSVVVSNQTSTTRRLTHQFTNTDVGTNGAVILPGSYSVWGLLTVGDKTPVEVGPFLFEGRIPSETLK